jgi:hypothetical protein
VFFPVRSVIDFDAGQASQVSENLGIKRDVSQRTRESAGPRDAKLAHRNAVGRAQQYHSPDGSFQPG